MYEIFRIKTEILVAQSLKFTGNSSERNSAHLSSEHSSDPVSKPDHP